MSTTSDDVPVSKRPAASSGDAGEEKMGGDSSTPAPAPAPAPVKVDTAKVNALSVKAAAMIRPYLDKATPALLFISNLIDIVEPYLFAAVAYLQHVWMILQPYHPHEFLPAISGFVLVFFGGNFFTLCAAVEAYRIVGFDDTKRSINNLVHSYRIARDASKKDDLLDEDDDGVADVKQINQKQLVIRKAAVIAKAVDPELVAQALTAIYGGLMAVVATLRVKFAACITLGVTVGGIAHNFVSTHVEPVLLELTPSDYKKWVSVSVRYGCELMGVFLAWFLQMTISAFHSSARGAQLFARGTLAYAVRHGYLQSNAIDEKGRFFNAFVLLFGFVGFWSQFWSGFALPFPLNILLLPVRFAEWGLRFLVFMLG